MSVIINDTTTTLNTGTGGDVMDESLVTQSDGVTEAKRPRVVPGGDDGVLQTFQETQRRTDAHVKDTDTNELLKSILFHMRLQTAALTRIMWRMGDTADQNELMHMSEED